ncbi:hypothetical protein NIES4103_31450 [Nostoc sp. NIES-4103]|nr:hypothetical protein NIES4103_31450 [Nostoc sp. NIES-4103]
MELLTVTEEEIKRLTPHQLIALNSTICIAMAKNITVKFAAKIMNVIIPQKCLDSIEAYLTSTEADYLVLLAIISDLIIKSFDFLGLLATAKDFISQAKQNQSYYDLLKSEHCREYDVTLTDAQRACDDYSDDFQNWLLSSR